MGENRWTFLFLTTLASMEAFMMTLIVLSCYQSINTFPHPAITGSYIQMSRDLSSPILVSNFIVRVVDILQARQKGRAKAPCRH